VATETTKLFGTDGVRGPVFGMELTADLVLRSAAAAAESESTRPRS
jgi:phosphomannomutase